LFVDEVTIYIRSGTGGAGVISFRKEKFIDMGGPDGGHGGRGGDVYIIAEEGVSSLSDFLHQRHFRAENGNKGEGGNRTGRSGSDMFVHVPLGTLIYEVYEDTLTSGEETESKKKYRFVADLSEKGAKVLVAKGGLGGKGNVSFVNSLNQAPRISETGASGEKKTLFLELKIIADVGLVGFPNAGKSTLLAHTTNAKPKIADYPFTTLTPQIGIYTLSPGRTITIADIPGIIEGASHGKGLGFKFLRHIERCRMLLYMVDLNTYTVKEVEDSLEILFDEIKNYSDELSGRKAVLCGNKIDMLEDPTKLPQYQAIFEKTGLPFFFISGLEEQGFDPLFQFLFKELETIPKIPVEIKTEAIYTLGATEITIEKMGEHHFAIHCERLERFVEGTDLSYPGSIRYLYRLFHKYNLDKMLAKNGAVEGDIIEMGTKRFEWI
jgi:GTP-binding protein